ncbi:MAG: MSMEG_0567/Sll0786 family nitrogen starvation N-acetyltransferase [Verrucomicrobiota bacterium]
MLIESFSNFTPHDYVFKVAESPFDLNGFWELRRSVFCEEQGIFDGSDRDAIDDTMIPIVCKTLIAGMEDQIVGCVRIHEIEPGVWKGSRLAVHRDYRRVRLLSPGVQVRNKQPSYRGLGQLGAGLIYKAVSSANRIGCHRFLATVQHQNEKFFQRLHWQTTGYSEFKGIRHSEMEADLDYYQPALIAV